MLGRLAELAAADSGDATEAAPDAREGRRHATERAPDATAVAEASFREGLEIGRRQGLDRGRRMTLAEARTVLDDAIKEATQQAGVILGRAVAGLDRVVGDREAMSVFAASDEGEKINTPPPRPQKAEAIATKEVRIGKPQQHILDALAWFEAARIAAPNRHQLAWAAGYRADTGHFGNLMSELAGAGLADRRDGSLVLTAAGRDRAVAPQGKITPALLVSRIMSKIDAPARKLLDALVQAYPRPMTREQLAAATGYRPDTGHFGNLISELTGPEIAVRVGRGEVRVADWVMLKG
jgi:hypothetical protein